MDRALFNQRISHPLQSFEWGEFRQKIGTKVIRGEIPNGSDKKETFTLTIHPIPKTKYTIGYLPKGTEPTKKMIEELKKIGKEESCIFIQLEPNVTIEQAKMNASKLGLVKAAHPLFTKYTFILNLVPSEEDLLKNMHSKTRYNIKVAQKHGVIIQEDNSKSAFKKYLELTDQTTKRQKFFAHTPNYHVTLWNTLPHEQMPKKNSLSSHLFTATYNNKTLAAWIVFVFRDTMYYPYGASSSEARNVMASNLLMWEVIRFGKRLNLRAFDMWGALGPNPDPNDPWFGFHKFKQGYNPVLTEFVGSFDLVLKPKLYMLYTHLNSIRWKLLKTLKR